MQSIEMAAPLSPKIEVDGDYFSPRSTPAPRAAKDKNLGGGNEPQWLKMPLKAKVKDQAAQEPVQDRPRTPESAVNTPGGWKSQWPQERAPAAPENAAAARHASLPQGVFQGSRNSRPSVDFSAAKSAGGNTSQEGISLSSLVSSIAQELPSSVGRRETVASPQQHRYSLTTPGSGLEKLINRTMEQSIAEESETPEHTNGTGAHPFQSPSHATAESNPRLTNGPRSSVFEKDPRYSNARDRLSRMSIVSPSISPSPELSQDIEERTERSASEVAGEVRAGLADKLPTVTCESRARIPTTNGTEMYLHLYHNDEDIKEHLAIVFGEHIHSKSLFDERPGESEHDRMTRGAYHGRLFPGRVSAKQEDEVKEQGEAPATRTNPKPPKAERTLVRIHSECYTGETAWSARCDCGEQLDEAARLMAEEGSGVIVYLRQEGRGIGLGEKLKAYNLQDLGADTVTANLLLRHPADSRSFGIATAILLDLGLQDIRLLTNNPDKIAAVEGKNKEIHVAERVPMVPLAWQNKGGFRSKEVDAYLKTKVQRMGHILDLA